MELRQAIEYALNGDAILFLGSGASKGAINKNDEEFPLGVELSHRLYDGVDELQQAADLFIDEQNEQGKNGKLVLIDFLKKEFGCKKNSMEQDFLSQIPWSRIYTTNYDDIIETIYRSNAKSINSYTTKNPANTVMSTEELSYLHINGYINSLTPDSLNDEFKLTDASYNTNSFTDSDWGILFQNDLKAYSVCIFIGFSLKYDLDIRRLIYNTNNVNCIFIVSPSESKYNIKTLEKYGEVYTIGLEGFVKETQKISKTFVPTKESEDIDKVILSNFFRVEKTFASKEPSDKEVLYFYTKGKRSKDLYYISEPSSEKFASVVKRICVEKIRDDILNGNDAVIIHSDIGNGKTEVIHQVCNALPSRYKIYSLKDSNAKISKEIEKICRSKYYSIVIVENFFNFYDEINMFRKYNCNNNVTLILSARTSIYKNQDKPINLSHVNVYDVNKLMGTEIDDIVRILNKYGYYNNKGKKDARNFIISGCKSRLQSISLSFFENEKVSNSFSDVFKRIIKKQDKYSELLLFLIMIKVMSLSLSFNDALELLDLTTYDHNFETSEDYSELLDWYQNEASIKSPALCVWILKNNNDLISIVFDVLVKAAQRATLGWKVNKKYLNYLKNILSFKHLKFVLDQFKISRTDKLTVVNNFYDRLKVMSYYNGKYYFWLQYAISSLELKDYESSKKHFEAAYANLPDSFKPFEINNHFARYKMELLLLENYTYNSSTIGVIEYIDELLKASGSDSDEEFYCYKMAFSYYRKLFEKFYNSFTEDERKILKNLAREKYKKCQKYHNSCNNFDFKKHLKEYSDEFLKLALHEAENDEYDFCIKEISYNHAFGQVVIDGKREPAKIYLKYVPRNIKLKVGMTVKTKILNYNTTYKNYSLSLVE